jgi:dihydrodipicolinate synthase/N-acetylneuraminate lyase
VIRAWSACDLVAVQDSFARLMRIFAATRRLGGIVGTKAALQLLDLPGGYPRRPRLPLPEGRMDDVRRLIADMGPHDQNP